MFNVNNRDTRTGVVVCEIVVRFLKKFLSRSSLNFQARKPVTILKMIIASSVFFKFKIPLAVWKTIFNIQFPAHYDV